jgi:hypothetical protein
MITSLLHNIVALSGWIETKYFQKALKYPVQTQEKQLRRILKAHKKLPWSPASQSLLLADFYNFPITRWSDYEAHLSEEKRKNINKSQVVRFEPTSGSTFERKWIPFTPEYITEINRAASVWIFDMYQQFPKIKTGRHYWSLSWLPHDLRSFMTNDDSELFPFWKRWLLSKIFLVPKSLAQVKSEEAWRLATQVYLLSSPRPSFVSIWSPTYLLSLFQLSESEKQRLEECLNLKQWVHFKNELSLISFPQIQFPTFEENFQQLLKELKLISCWMSGSSSSFSGSLSQVFSSSQFQGKGLWATEGVVTFPFKGRWPLALRSHFYEFRNLQTNQVVSLSNLKIGDFVSPIMTTSSGLLRYELGDQLLVTDFFEKTPCFEFLGRSGASDLVGEKLDLSVFFSLKKKLQKDFPQISYFQFGYFRSPQISYCLALPKTEFTQKLQGHLADQVEMALQKHHHYRVARQLHQLQSVSVILLENQELKFVNNNQIRGQVKAQDLIDFT